MRTHIALLLLLLAPSPPVEAAEPADYAGTFVLADRAATDAALAGAVEQGAQQFAAIARPIVRGVLRKVVRAVSTFRFEPGENTLTIRTEENLEGWTTDLAGTDVVKKNAQGDEITLRRWMEDGALHTYACADSGCSQLVFALTPAGDAMTLQVTTTSKRLDSPLRYEINYKRQ